MTQCYTRLKTHISIEVVDMKKNNRLNKRKIVPICEAALAKDLALLKELLILGADINEKDYNGLTAIYYATQNGDYEMTKFLIENGADYEVRDPYGNTPLSNAVFYYKKMDSDDSLIKLLIDSGADINAENNYGVSPLSLAHTIAGFPYLSLFDDKS